MKKEKLGLFLILLGNLLYLSYIYFSGNETGNFSQFTSWLLLGLSIGTNLIGIVITSMYISKNKELKK